ncbi:pyroglutamyl-peptidase I [Planctomycetes bacterium K23_9]|uniref:Pyrrolidone-carboxylate peptidase n=1 Tax=Stieleria marina TaxID=1930275 RepID=A0A517P112_9BACT|nr:Pyrrolidone-carboxylate peptidase [Planctomycetes bacterium K23_9]
MTRVLITAFEPYDRWKENSSWLALVDFTGWYDGELDVTTRRYPVDLGRMSEKLRDDLRSDFDLAIHLGQSPGSPLVKVESVGLNVRSDGTPLIQDAPAAYRSTLDLVPASRLLTDAGIPNELSHHAGTYLCNAVMFLSHHYITEMNNHTKTVFVHLPLTPAQAAKDAGRLASMSTPMSSAAIAMIMEQLATQV